MSRFTLIILIIIIFLLVVGATIFIILGKKEKASQIMAPEVTRNSRFIEVKEEYNPNYRGSSYFFKIDENKTIEVESSDYKVNTIGKVWLIENKRKSLLIKEVYPYNPGGPSISVFHLNLPNKILITETIGHLFYYEKKYYYIDLNNKNIPLELEDINGRSIKINKEFVISLFEEGRCTKKDDEILIKGILLNGEYNDIGFRPKKGKCIFYGESGPSEYVPYGAIKIAAISSDFLRVYFKFVGYNDKSEKIWEKDFHFNLKNQKLFFK